MRLYNNKEARSCERASRAMGFRFVTPERRRIESGGNVKNSSHVHTILMSAVIVKRTTEK